METAKTLSKTDASVAGWSSLLLTSVKIAVVGFVVLQAKEWFDAGMLDTPATAMDAGLIAAGVFVVNAILKLLKL
ncbi:hypothetical protein HUU40_15810 [candidate division KSB1 bacterium]|nr:hypothetical protein [candidate division KSB1 bacterium]